MVIEDGLEMFLGEEELGPSLKGIVSVVAMGWYYEVERARLYFLLSQRLKDLVVASAFGLKSRQGSSICLIR